MSGVYAIEFFVPGVPVSQGSKTFVPTARGPRARESNEKKLKPWRASIVELAPALAKPIGGAVALRVVFVFPRPKAHFRGGQFVQQLRREAPHWHVSMPDLDKLQRALGDAIAGVLIENDSQIARWDVMKKYGERPGAKIELTSLSLEELPLV